MNDFDQIMANANSNTTKSNKSFDKNVWRERKQQERQEVYDFIESRRYSRGKSGERFEQGGQRTGQAHAPTSRWR